MDRYFPVSALYGRGAPLERGPLIRTTIGDSIRRYRLWRKREMEKRERVAIGEFGHGLSITNLPVEFCPINLCARAVFIRSSSSFSFDQIFVGRSFDVSEGTNQALMHTYLPTIDGQVPREKLIVIPAHLLSHVYAFTFL